MKPSKRSQKIKSFIAMDIVEAAEAMERKGANIISFSLGEPDFDTPKVVEAACIQALRDKKTKYTHSQGSFELRKAIAKHYQKKFKLKVDPDLIIVTQGTSPAFFLIFSALLEKGDEVILPNPHYPCDPNYVEFLGGKPVFFNLSEEDGYQWNVKDVQKKITKRTKAIFITSPSNPTGSILSEKNLKALAKLNIPLVCDEIYQGISYGTREHTLLEFTKNCFVVNGFSKAYSMTGFRLGYVIAPKTHIREMQKIQQNFYISANSFVQECGITALEKGAKDVERMRKEYEKRRAAMLSGLKKLGFRIPYTPDGAFYVMVNVKHLSNDSYGLAFDILQKAHVAVTPGIDFGSASEGYLRFSYAVSIPKIKEGLKRLEVYLKKYHGSSHRHS